LKKDEEGIRLLIFWGEGFGVKGRVGVWVVWEC
jgi:hypothetical protein